MSVPAVVLLLVTALVTGAVTASFTARRVRARHAPGGAPVTTAAGDPPHQRNPQDRGRRALAGGIAVALTAVIVAPIALSSGDLVAWASSPKGLGLTGFWPLVVFVALDAAAAVCVGFVIYSAWRGEGAGAFGLLVWVFAGGSAVANYRHGQTTDAPDDAVFFAAMSLTGPVLLHMTVHRIRRWIRITEGEQVRARAHFGLRWLPGVAFKETLAAWKVSVRAGISRPEQAIVYVRECQLLANLSKAAKDQPPLEAIRYAVGAIEEPLTVHTVRVWLADRGLIVDTAVLETVLGTHQPTVVRADPARDEQAGGPGRKPGPGRPAISPATRVGLPRPARRAGSDPVRSSDPGRDEQSNRPGSARAADPGRQAGPGRRARTDRSTASTRSGPATRVGVADQTGLPARPGSPADDPVAEPGQPSDPGRTEMTAMQEAAARFVEGYLADHDELPSGGDVARAAEAKDTSWGRKFLRDYGQALLEAHQARNADPAATANTRPAADGGETAEDRVPSGSPAASNGHGGEQPPAVKPATGDQVGRPATTARELPSRPEPALASAGDPARRGAP